MMENPQLLQDETLSKKLITKGSRTYFFTMIVAPIGYLLRMFLSDAVSVSEVGIFYSVLGLMGMLASYNDLGLTEAMMYFIPKFRIKNEKAKARLVILASFVMQLLTGILIFCLVYCGADRLALHHFHDALAADILKILAFYFFGINFVTLCTTMFVSFQDTFCQGLTQSIQQIVNLIFTCIFRATASLTVISYARVFIIGIGTTILVGGTFVRKKYRHVFRTNPDETFLPASPATKKAVLKQHIKYALRVFLVANVSSLLGNVDQQVIINVLGPQASGFFSNFQALLMAFTLIVTPMFGLLFPLTTELSTKQDNKKFWLLQHVMYTYFGVFAMIIAVFFTVFGQEISVLLFGEDFRFSGYMLQWASPALIFSCWASISLSILAGLGKIKQRLGVVILALVVNIFLNWFLLIFLWKGLIFSTLILSVSWAVMALGGMYVIYKYHPFTLDRKLLGKNLFLMVVLGILMMVGKTYWPGVLSTAFLSTIARGGLFFWLGIRFLCYAGVIALFNASKIQLFWEEVKKLKN